MPKVSIVIPTYNAEIYLEKTIQSILKQEFTDFECIFVDDGSTDKSVEVIKSFSDKRIHVIESKPSGGPARPRNLGIKAAQGEYIFLFDSDDIMLTGKIKDSIDTLDNNANVDVLFTNFQSIDEHDALLTAKYIDSNYNESLWSITNKAERVNIFSPKEIYPAIVRANFIGTSSIVIRSRILKNGHHFNESLSNSDDRVLWVELAKQYNFCFLNIIGHQYRIHNKSISHKGNPQLFESRIQGLKIIRTNCKEQTLIKVIDKQISICYQALSYQLRQNNQKPEAIIAAVKALNYDYSINNFKQILASLVRYIR